MSEHKRKSTTDGDAATKKAKASAVDVESLQYLAGFGVELASEALPNALPPTQNTPQRFASCLLYSHFFILFDLYLM
jgi:homogentisate 1,2-dioxygenase